MDDRDAWSRRRFVVGAPLLAVGTGGCMRFAADDGPLVPTIEDVTVPEETRAREPVPVDMQIAYEGDEEQDVRVAVDVDDRLASIEEVTLEPGSTRQFETAITLFEPGERRLSVELRYHESFDEWAGTFAVVGQPLTLEWEETFVPADHADTSADTRNLAFACFELRLRDGDDVIATYDVGSDEDVEFDAGAYPAQSIEDDRLEEFDGERGRWLGTDDRRTDLLFLDHEAFYRADTLELHGYSLLENETTVEARTDEETIDEALVPSRDDGEAVIEIDLEESADDS
ncbi:hypothetical protein [Natronobacterium texcoconense]|uniref:Uncharacterized protein n=1 Tax=Natronobacterium texcoconense TaxID=1095778 RepID=A0A1H1HPQ0_NATTX|nr:hypothetical protein [Natronobacterium texcoconense]SDR27046.1 hypothetical protein SAMN04489842_2915 [Natronobacterium texcoconense]